MSGLVEAFSQTAGRRLIPILQLAMQLPERSHGLVVFRPVVRPLEALPPQRLLGLGRWCADAGRPTRFKPSSPSPTDAVRDGSAKLDHPVQNVTREHGLTPLPR